MDAVALQTLREEMRDDCRVIREARQKAVDRYGRHDEIAYEGCAHHLCRMYNAFGLELDPSKLELLLKYAGIVSERMPKQVEDFIGAVAREQQIEL